MPYPTYFNYSPVFPNPIYCVKDFIVYGSAEVNQRFPWNGLQTWFSETWRWVLITFYLDWGVVLLPLVFFSALTALRLLLDRILFRRIPEWCKLDDEGKTKFPDSVWKMLVFTVTWVWAAYLVWFSEDQYFFNLKRHWDKWHPGEAVTPSIYWLYMFQLGFYYHQAYATVFMDAFRKGIALMMVHHVIAIALLFFSYVVRFHKIGFFILFIQDIGDVTIELSKTVVYFKKRNGIHCKKTEISANICFAIYTLQHILFRLYWFPCKAIYSTMVVCIVVYPGGPYYLPFNLLLWIMFGMQVYWFKFIVRLLIKLLYLRKEIEDARELDEEEESEIGEAVSSESSKVPTKPRHRRLKRDGDHANGLIVLN